MHGWVLIGLGSALLACSLRVEPIECMSDDGCRAGARCVEHVCTAASPPVSSCAAAIGAGDDHTCVVRRDGTAWCWGRNDASQLGDDSLVDRQVPVQPAGIELSLAAISGGKSHTCAVRMDGKVQCWGLSTSRQVGLLAGAPVPGFDGGATAIVAGDAHSCALVNSAVMCWGASSSGQLGIGPTDGSPRPEAMSVTGIVGRVTKFASGSNTTCAISATDSAGSAHRLWCWGGNSAGQVGDGTTAVRTAPVAVTALDDDNPIDVAVGVGFMCAATAEGAVFCVGRNERGQSGQSALTGVVTTLQPVSLPVAARAVVAGNRFACAIDDQRRAWCWGDDSNGQLADGKFANHAIPTLASYADVADLVAGENHLCARAMDGSVRCSGIDAQGQLGDGLRTARPSPQPIAGLTGALGVAAGDRHTCAVLGDRTVQCWGYNDFGALGDDTWSSRALPAPVVGVRGVTQVVVGRNHSCALADGTVWCWGRNHHGQLGYNDVFDDRAALPRQVNGLSSVSQIAAGGDMTCALVGSGPDSLVKCWGAAANGALGDAFQPTEVMGLAPGATAIAVGATHACARESDGSVWCWGRNETEQLGVDSSTAASATAIQVKNLTGVDAIAAGRGFTCAHVSSGGTRGTWCWGTGADGEIGDGLAHASSASPLKVTGATDATAIAAGETHACASGANMLACWGGNASGQLGNGRYDNALSPVITPLTPVSQVALGLAHTCAITSPDGAVACWGDGRFGQLGDGVMAPATGAPVAPLLTCP